jgi:chloride channel protein, CIC family
VLKPSSPRTEFNILKVALLAAFVGILGGIAAEVLDRLIGFVINLSFYQRLDTEIVPASGHQLGPLVIFVPAIGGLIVGLLARYGSELVRGHGIPEAMQAVLVNQSRIPPRVAILKPLSAAVSIGTGGPFGAEGPIIGVGAALGSIIGQALRTTTAERKVLLACGAAAGIAAVFGTPLAAVVLAIELLVFEFGTRSFIPLSIAAVMAAEVHNVLFGAEPVFTLKSFNFGGPLDLALYLLLGLLCGLLATGLTRLLYRIEDWFHHLKLNTYLWPALGGLFVGIVGYLVPRFIDPQVDVFGPGYVIIEGILNGNYAIGFLVILLISKASVWLFALGSGTSGGVLAPVFMMGAALGSLFGLLAAQIFPELAAAPAAFALVGMVAVFGSATRATFAAIVFAFEMTHNYEAILPVMFACVIADIVSAHLMKTSILTEHLRRGGILAPHELQVDPLSLVRVGEVMSKDATFIPPTMPVEDVITRINKHDPELTRHQALLLADERKGLKGIITRGDLLKAMREGRADMTVGQAGTTQNLITTTPDTIVREALNQMLRYDIGRLPVIDEKTNTVIGYLSRGNIMAANLRKLNEETEAQPGWVGRRHLPLRLKGWGIRRA